MTVLKYVLSTSLKNKVRDIETYNKLKKEEKDSKKSYKKAYRGLVVDLGLQFEDVTSDDCQGCIVCCWEQEQDFGRDCGPVAVLRKTECKNFNELKPCSKSECKHYSENKAYFVALQEWLKSKRNRIAFWPEKFARQK